MRLLARRLSRRSRLICRRRSLTWNRKCERPGRVSRLRRPLMQCSVNAYTAPATLDNRHAVAAIVDGPVHTATHPHRMRLSSPSTPTPRKI